MWRKVRRAFGRTGQNGGKQAERAIRQALTGSLVALMMAFCPVGVHARGPQPASTFDSKLNTVASAQLPTEGQDVLALIRQGGPFPHDKDGVVFGNRERILPAEARGYYREYTVRTPRERSRGARRIVCGGKRPTGPDACYYTDDHYASFRKIVE
jgi:ribonuclease T1